MSPAVKAEFVERLASAGLQSVETTSFVRPDRVPQLADAEQVLASFRPREGVRYPVLVPNERGLERALAVGVQDVAVFASATETFAQKNLGCSMDESMTMFEPVVLERSRRADVGARLRLDVFWRPVGR